MSSPLLDSNIIIDHMNNVDEATAFLDSLSDWIISSITVYEVLAGCTGDRSSQHGIAKKLFGFCSVISPDSLIAEAAAEFQRKQKSKRKIADFIIAATANINGLKLATRNPSDFKKICTVHQPYGIN